MEKRKKRGIIFLIILLCMVLIFVGGLLHQKREKTTSVYTAEVKMGTITSKVSASGRIQPKTTVDISSSVMGEIIRLGVEEGDWVEKGDFLLQIDKTEYESRKEQAEAGWRSARANIKLAEANLEKAQQDLERQRELLSKKLTSQEMVDSAETNLKVQKATLESYQEQAARSKAALDEVQDALSKTTIYAPMAGIVSQLNAEEGEVVIMGTMNNPGTIIMTISDMSIMEVEAEVDESDIVNVAIGQEVEITVDAMEDSIIKGSVTEIGNTGITFGLGTQEEITNFLVTVTITDTSELIVKLKPGMSASIDVITNTRENTLYVPLQCVLNRTTKQIKPLIPTKKFTIGPKKTENIDNSFDDKEKPKKGVFVVGDQEKSNFVMVTTGIHDDTHIEILSGLEEGQKIVAGSYLALRNLRNDTKLKITKSPLAAMNK